MNRYDFTDIVITGLFLALVICIIISILIPAINLHNDLNNKLDELQDRLEYHPIDRMDNISIETLQTDISLSGRFMLGYGYTGSKTVYSYYIKTDDGGYVLQQVDAGVSKIYMNENDKPYITKHYSETNRLKKQFISSYSFHVPNGTIVRNYDVMK